MDRIVFAVTVFLLGSLGVRGSNDAEEEIQLALAKANNVFGWKMYEQLKNTEGNLIFSPLSVNSPLMLLWVASGGRTKEEIATALGLPQQYNDTTLNKGFFGLEKRLKHEGGNMTLRIADGLISNQQVKPQFKHFLEDYDHVMTKQVDFTKNTQETLNTINEFIANKTNNKINKFLDYLSPDSTMILVDALYFDGHWLSKFDPDETRKELFHTSEKSTISTDMMFQRNIFSLVNETDYQALKLGYQDGVSMVVLLPKNIDGIRQLEDSLPNFDWEDLDKKLESQSTVVEVTLPKFLIETKNDLRSALEKLGIRALFGQGADLSRMYGRSGSYVNEITQKTFIKVGEEGTEAAAATGIISVMNSIPIGIPKFYVDHPFVFLLRHEETKTNILIGRVSEPQ